MNFKGFHAKTNKGTPCWVMNEGVLDDGTPAWKVRMGRLGPYHGWSGGCYRDVHYDGAVGLIAKSKVKRGKAK